MVPMVPMVPTNNAHGAYGAQCTGRQQEYEEELGAIKDIHGGANLTQPRLWILSQTNDCNFLCFHHFLKRVLFVLFSHLCQGIFLMGG